MIVKMLIELKEGWMNTVKMRISAVSKCKEELNGAEENNNWKKKKQTRKNQQLIRWYEGMDQESGIQSSVII